MSYPVIQSHIYLRNEFVCVFFRRRNLCDVEAKLSHVTLQLTRREHELSDANEKIAQLKQRIGEVERNADRYAAERDKAKRELEAMRELCSKMEIEKEKLNAEVNEYAEIRRELERDNDKLRNELMQVSRHNTWLQTKFIHWWDSTNELSFPLSFSAERIMWRMEQNAHSNRMKCSCLRDDWTITGHQYKVKPKNRINWLQSLSKFLNYQLKIENDR